MPIPYEIIHECRVGNKHYHFRVGDSYEMIHRGKVVYVPKIGDIYAGEVGNCFFCKSVWVGKTKKEECEL